MKKISSIFQIPSIVLSTMLYKPYSSPLSISKNLKAMSKNLPKCTSFG